MHWFRHLTRTANVTSVALEIINALGLEVLLQELQHSDTGRGQFQLQAEVTRRLDEKITTGSVEAATSLAPSDAEVFCAHGCRLDAGSLRRYQEVRNRIVVLGIQSVHQKSESFADTLLAAGGKVRCPVTQGVGRVRLKGFRAARFAEHGAVVRQAAPKAVRVSALSAVVLKVAEQTVDERLGGGQAGQKRVEKASVAQVVEAGVVSTHGQQRRTFEALQSGNGGRLLKVGSKRVRGGWC